MLSLGLLHHLPICRLRVGLIQALGRLVQCKGLSGSTMFLLCRFGWFLLRGVGRFMAICQFLCSCLAPALHAPRPQHCSVVKDWAWKDPGCAGPVIVVLQARAVAVGVSSLKAAA